MTGASGEDGSALYRDPDLLGLYYAAPYVVLEPELCFVLIRDRQPCGYVLGTQDSTAFAARCERDWFSALRQRYVLPSPTDLSPDAGIVRAIHLAQRADADLDAYPAHLHIDLLPIAQGQGWGRRLLDAFVQQLRARGVPGVHLGVGQQNQRAVQFYERMGFRRIKEAGKASIYGMRL